MRMHIHNRKGWVVLGRMFTLAVRANMLTTKPALPTLNLGNARAGFFEVDKLARVLAVLPADIAPQSSSALSSAGASARFAD